MTKFTPGPWTVEDPLDGCLSIVQAGKPTYEWEFIANCPEPDEDDHLITFSQVKANANLIAAAPQLYEALEWALSRLSVPGARSTDYEGPPSEYSVKWNAAQAALKAAVPEVTT